MHVLVVEGDGEALTVEVLNGALESRKQRLWVDGHGEFVIVAAVNGFHEGTRVYLRLRRLEGARAPDA